MVIRQTRGYTKYKGDKPKLIAVRLSAKTIAGIEEIRQALQSKYPADKYPTIQAALEVVIQQNLSRLKRPAVLRAEVADFKARYPQDTTPKEGNKAVS